MVMYVVTALVFLLIITNYFLGYKLYIEPKNEGYFTNVNHYNVIQQKDIMPNPKYVAVISALLRYFHRSVYFFRSNDSDEYVCNAIYNLHSYNSLLNRHHEKNSFK